MPGALPQASGSQEPDGLSSSLAGAPQQWPWQGLMQKALDASGLNQVTGTQGLSPDAAGILAGIQALLAQQDVSSPTSDEKAEQVKHSWSELPKLPELGPESSLAFSDYIHMIAPLVQDMSTTSSEYWALLKRETEEWYRTYLVSDPMARLQLQPSASAQLLSVEQAEQKVGGAADYGFTQGSPRRTDSGEGQVTASPPMQTSCAVCTRRGAGTRALAAPPPESRSCREPPSCVGVPPPVEEVALKNGVARWVFARPGDPGEGPPDHSQDCS